MICVSVNEPSIEAMVKVANSVDCDLVEVRLDFVANLAQSKHLLVELEKIGKPVIATCIPDWDHGNFKGPDEARFELLAAVLPYCDYVSVEMKASPKLRDALIQSAKDAGVKVIITYHDFESTPDLSGIIDILEHQKSHGADVAKVAFMPSCIDDVLNTILAITKSGLGIPVIALSMGELGRISRVMSVLAGGFCTFAASGAGREAGPGQLTVSELKTILRILEK